MNLIQGPNLRNLSISQLEKVTDITLFRISQRCAKLQVLSINYCERITDSGFEVLSACKNLKELNCKGMDRQYEKIDQPFSEKINQWCQNFCHYLPILAS